MKTTKPVLGWDIAVLEDIMCRLGYKVKFIGKPETLEGICSLDGANLDSIASLSEESRDRIQAYLDEKKADGGLVINKQIHGKKGLGEYGNITLIPYVLEPA